MTYKNPQLDLLNDPTLRKPLILVVPRKQDPQTFYFSPDTTFEEALEEARKMVRDPTGLDWDGAHVG